MLCKRSISTSMHAHAVRREALPKLRTAERRFSDGGDGLCVVALRTAKFKEAWHLVIDRVALIKEALSLRISMRFLSFFSLPMVSQRKRIRRAYRGRSGKREMLR